MQPFCGSDAESDRESANLSRRSIHFAILYEIARGELLAAPPPLVHLSERQEGGRVEKEQTQNNAKCSSTKHNTKYSMLRHWCDSGAKIKMFCTGCSSA